MDDPTDELLKLARFQVLDRRNCSEPALERLLGRMADEVERLDLARQQAVHERDCAVEDVARLGLAIAEYVSSKKLGLGTNAAHWMRLQEIAKEFSDGRCWIKGCQQPKGHAGFCDSLPPVNVGDKHGD